MRPEEAGAELARHTQRLKEAGTNLNPSAMVHAAKEVAAGVRQQAAHAGHRVGIRIVQKHDGVRLTVTGPRAELYRGLVERELAARAPMVQAEIRSQITRRAK